MTPAAQTSNYQVSFPASPTDLGGGILSILNPEGVDLFIERAILDVATKATAACTVDLGVGADPATAYDNLIDGMDVGTAAGVFDNIENQGTNGKSTVKWPAGQYLTLSTASGAAAGLVGELALHWSRD